MDDIHLASLLYRVIPFILAHGSRDVSTKVTYETIDFQGNLVYNLYYIEDKLFNS